MISQNFDTQLSAILKNGGWDSAREVNIDPFIEFINRLRFRLNDYALSALKSLGGLSFEMPAGGLSFITFDLADETDFVLTADDAQKLQDIVREAACPIGYGGGCVLFISVSGACYLLQDEWLALIASKNLNDMLKFIFEGSRENCWEIPLSSESD